MGGFYAFGGGGQGRKTFYRKGPKKGRKDRKEEEEPAGFLCDLCGLSLRPLR
jgi:hypothetical protein